MPERGLNKMNRCATIKGVRSVGVAHPMARRCHLDPGPLRRLGLAVNYYTV
jgi:hypothetical protein